MKPRDLAIYVFLAVAWGLSFVVVLEVVRAFGWVGAVSFRALVAGAVLLAVAGATRRRLDFSFGIMPLVIVGATTVVGQLIGLAYATPRIGTAMTAIIIATIPLLSMIIGRLAGVETITARGLAGLMIGILGMVMLVGFPAVPVTPDFIAGCIAAFASSVAAAVGSVYAGARLRRVGAFELSTGAFIAGGLISLPLMLAVPVPTVPVAYDYLMLLILGALMSAFNYVLYFSLVASIGPTRAISVEFAVTVVAVIVGALLLSEPLTVLQIIGAVVIACGCALVLDLLPSRRLAKPPLPPAAP